MTRRNIGNRRFGVEQETRGFDVEIGRQVRLRRILLGLSQAQLASSLLVSPQQMALIERGASQLHSAQLFLLSRALGVPVEVFFSTLSSVTTGARSTTTTTMAQAAQTLPNEFEIHPDGRSNQEIKQIVKAFSRIPQGERRLRILRIMQNLSNDGNISKTDLF